MPEYPNPAEISTKWSTKESQGVLWLINEPSISKIPLKPKPDQETGTNPRLIPPEPIAPAEGPGRRRRVAPACGGSAFASLRTGASARCLFVWTLAARRFAEFGAQFLIAFPFHLPQACGFPIERRDALGILAADFADAFPQRPAFLHLSDDKIITLGAVTKQAEISLQLVLLHGAGMFAGQAAPESG